MKKLIVIGIVAAMVMGLSAAAFATGDAWLVYMHVGLNTTGEDGAPSGKFGIRTQTTDLVSSYTTGNYNSAVPELWFTDGTHPYPSNLGAGGSPRYYQATISKNNAAPTNTVEFVYSLEIKATSGTTVWLTAWNPTGPTTDWDASKFDNLYLYEGTNKSNGFKFDSTKNGADIVTNISGDYYQKSYVMPEGGIMEFQLIAGGGIPEPGGMAALFTGLVGLIGFGIRRRK